MRNKMINNEWVIRICTAVIAGVILYILFGNGDTVNNQENTNDGNQQRITNIAGDLNVNNAIAAINGEVNLGDCGSISGSGQISGSGSIGCSKPERTDISFNNSIETVENLLLITPDCQVAFLGKSSLNQNIPFANCLMNHSDCVIFDEFKVENLPIDINKIYYSDNSSRHCTAEGKVKIDFINRKLLSISD